MENNKPAGLRMERRVFEELEKERQIAMDRGEPVAFSVQSWVSFLAMKGLKSYQGGINE